MASGNQSNYVVHNLLRAHDWQHRHQFDEVCDWWRGGGPGVCALVGMGGAGKTAIAERFLSVLSGVMPAATADEATEKDASLPEPHSTFVYSFYDDDKPENFFGHLQMWLEGTPRVETVLSVRQLMFLVQQRQGLIVLDGLEKVQQDGARGNFGKLESENLRLFLNHVASGSARQLSVLVTSRFPLADLRDRQHQFFQTIAIEEIDVATGVQLLRDRGVLGGDSQLEPIVKQCGRHALTVDFAGGYIKEYGDGDPATPLDFDLDSEELKQRLDDEPNESRRIVLLQEYRFARIAERYREAMLSSDEAAIALLERICLFRLGVESETLATIFTGPDATKVSGKALAGLDADQLQKKLDWLVRMRIVEKAEGGEIKAEGGRRKDEKPDSSFLLPPSSLYTIHPAVRDGFFSGIGRADRQASHEAVRKGLEVSLGDAPGRNPSDPATLDLLEEIVHHTMQSGQVNEAWNIYWDRIGNGRNLQYLGDFERGTRICNTFSGNRSPDKATLPGLLNEKLGHFLNDWAVYLCGLGQLSRAIQCFERVVAIAREKDDPHDTAVSSRNLSSTYIFCGRLSDGITSASRSIEFSVVAFDKSTGFLVDVYAEQPLTTIRSAHSNRGYCYALRGMIKESLSDFAVYYPFSVSVPWLPDRPHFGVGDVWHRTLQTKLGQFEKADDIDDSEFKDVVRDDSSLMARYAVLRADIACKQGNLNVVTERLRAAQQLAMEQDVLCWSALVQARLELAAVRSDRIHAVDQAIGPDESGHAVDGAIGPDESGHYERAETAIAEGLKIARDCGYGLYHIDLLLEAARLHLLRGKPQSALDDLRLALDDGIPADDETGQPELLAANHEACGYAWAIPAGLHLRAEAQLLQAAQQLGSDSFVPAKRDELPGEANHLIDEAQQNLEAAMDRWQPLHDPEPERPDQNFQLDGKPYNYRAADTHRVITDLGGGLLTRYPLERPSMKKTVLELDLIGYSDIARALEQQLGVELVMQFNDQIQGFVDRGLGAAHLKRDDVIVQSTGDGAIVVLDNPEQAHLFAENLNTACQELNSTKTVDSAKRWFRIAATTGDIEIRGKELAGTLIANAVRLETAGASGHFLVDIPTWEQLPAELKEQYLPEELIQGKRDEMIPARRIVFDDSPRPDHVMLTLDMQRSDFNEPAAKAFVREFSRLLNTDKIFLVRIVTGSVEVTLAFEDSAALADFINRHVSGDVELQRVFDNWKVNGVSYHAKLKQGKNAPADSPPATGAIPTKKQFGDLLDAKSLDELRRLTAVLDIGLSNDLSKQATISGILNWATTDARKRELADELDPQ